MRSFVAWLERVDPGTHRRIKGLRLVTAYGIAAALGALHDVTQRFGTSVSVGVLAASFALWASVSEARHTRPESSRDLALLCAAATVGALVQALLSPSLFVLGRGAPEFVLLIGAFLASYLKRYGVTGAGVGSQFYIGQVFALTMKIDASAWPAILVAGCIASVACIVPRLLSGPAEKPAELAALSPVGLPGRWNLSAPFIMGMQAAIASLVVVSLNAWFHMPESVWAVTACVYVVAGSAIGTAARVRQRIIGTLIGVPLGLACLPLAEHAPLVIWTLAAVAMVIYAMALPERYDIACAAFAFTLVVTLAASGEHSVMFLSARIWQTLLGGVLGLLAARLILPLRAVEERAASEGS
ncbi:FUSC family protein [Dyella sp. C11]|uniref:FUSC family protein n=1 Tax=Dyella sp. C11 TaxID=2126991 RepID=UPI000D65989C|nr:FUSC family protein [Dyella sp. C11]